MRDKLYLMSTGSKMRRTIVTKFYPYAAQQAERLEDYESAMRLYNKAATHALTVNDRVSCLDAYMRCSALKKIQDKTLSSSGQEPTETKDKR